MPRSDTEAGRTQREERLQYIMDQQDELVYYGKYTFLDTEAMTTFERDEMHSRLVKKKAKERETNEAAINRIKNTRSSSSSGRKFRKR